jgi:hypothetical protein
MITDRIKSLKSKMFCTEENSPSKAAPIKPNEMVPGILPKIVASRKPLQLILRKPEK